MDTTNNISVHNALVLFLQEKKNGLDIKSKDKED